MDRRIVVPLLFVLLLGLVSAAGIVLLQYGSLTQGSDRDLLLTLRLVPVLLAMQLAGCGLSLLGLKIVKLGRPAWLVQALATGMATGMVVALPWELAQVLEQGHWGMSNLYEVSLLILAITGLVGLVFDHAYAPGRLLPFVAPILVAGTAFAAWLVSVGAATPQELVPALQNSILPLHVLANFIGYGCFAVGAGAGAAILVRARADVREKASRLPPQDILESIGYRATVIGFPLFSLAVLLGCVWAYQAWGGYWSWDPKETWALIVWLVYAAYLHVRLTRRPRPVVLAWWLLAGFAVTLFCYIGVNMFLSGLHSYGSLATS
jgi:cytochrome c-type biogenesis protein CcsB